jgi:hypothetical protein
MALTERNVRRYERAFARVIRGHTAYDKVQAVHWYEDAESYCRFLASNYDVSLEQACGVMSAFSPRVQWSRNKTLAELYLQGEPTPGLTRSRESADAVMVGGIDALNGLKTHAFARNMYGDTDAVTIDVHMMRAAGFDDRDRPTVVQYRELSVAVRRLARKHKMQPRDMQALIWIKQRGRAE